jgi:hypothetical protein
VLDKARLLALKHGYLRARRLYRWTQHARSAHARAKAQEESPAFERLIREHAAGKTFVDVGAMWGIHGANAFLAEQAGATKVIAVDVSAASEEFLARRRSERSRIEVIQGDINHEETLSRIGQCDVVLCAGVLYHTPNPLELLFKLRSICTETLLLRTMMIPELMGLRNMAVFYPYLDSRQRKIWRLEMGEQKGITGPYEPENGYGNWFWGLTPSSVESALRCAGFEVEQTFLRPFSGTFVCRAAEVQFARVSGEWGVVGPG